MSQPEATAQGASGIDRLKLYVDRNERGIAASFFIAGFLFDIVTTGRIDSWLMIGQQALYLAVIMAALLQMFHEQGLPEPDRATLGRLKRWYHEYRPAILHFLLGALLNLYAIFFFKSSSLLVSFAFLAFLVALVLANETKRFKALGLSVKFALLSLCFLAFASYLVPVLAGTIGLGMFLLSMLVGSLPLLAAAWRVRRSAPERFALARRQILWPLGFILIAFLTSYLLRVIPPVPLSIPFIGVYHSVERSDAGYRLSHERPAWRLWHNGDQWFRAQPGDRIFVFFRVFSPARFSDQVQMRWYWKDPARGWTLHDSIPIRIVGGREQGFRGYGVKSNYQPGDWKVQVESNDGREIGRVYFNLEPAPAAPRALLVDVD